MKVEWDGVLAGSLAADWILRVVSTPEGPRVVGVVHQGALIDLDVALTLAALLTTSSRPELREPIARKRTV
jgi:hypothetical protein